MLEKSDKKQTKNFRAQYDDYAYPDYGEGDYGEYGNPS